MLELFATAEALRRHPDLTGGAAEVSARDAAALVRDRDAAGLIAVCRLQQPTATECWPAGRGCWRSSVDCNEPGNLGAIIRTADAAGADAVVLDGGVDPYNGKVVRATAGSLFHLPVLVAAEDLLAACAQVGLTTLATAGAAPPRWMS